MIDTNASSTPANASSTPAKINEDNETPLNDTQRSVIAEEIIGLVGKNDDLEKLQKGKDGEAPGLFLALRIVHWENAQNKNKYDKEDPAIHDWCM